ncbi:MAG TPA: chorismate synthase [Dehalococcoidia bacterium]|nr:chorismate synthase [Dehalococcoidia bacterium]
MIRFLTAGESHGPGLIIQVEGLPAGVPLTEAMIRADLARRQLGYGRGGRMKIETDYAEIWGGVRHGLTLGSTIALLIRNRDWENWKDLVMKIEPVEEDVKKVTRLRPGHADLTGAIKYGFDDVRNVLERASARETAARVAAGAVAKALLTQFGVRFFSHTVAIGRLRRREWEGVDWEAVEASPLRTDDPDLEERAIAAIDAAREAGDTLGGEIEVRAEGVPIGLGSYVQWDRKLDARIAQAIMSINAVKAVAIGAGLEAGALTGREHHDVITYQPGDPGSSPWRHLTNHAGGIVGGISNGEPIIVRFGLKPIATLGKPLPSVDLLTHETVNAHYERSDVCVVPAAGVIGEAMLALVLADAFAEKFGGDSLAEMQTNYRSFMVTVDR